MSQALTLLFLLTLAAGASANDSDAIPPQARLLVSNPAPFVGEEFLLALEIRSAGRPGAIAPRWPGLDPFAAVELPFPPPRRETTGTTTWLVQRAEQALLPLAPGSFTLSGAGAESGGTFIAAPATTVRVRPLPAAGRPAGFAGAVGEAAMTLTAPGSGSREIVLTLRGPAPLDAFPLPVPHLGRAERLVPLSDSVSGAAPAERQRTLRYLYLPGGGRQGELRFTLPLFQPQEERYLLLEVGLIRRQSLYLWLSGGLFLFTPVLLWLWRRRRHPAPRTLAEVLTRLVGPPVSGLSRQQIAAALQQRGIPPQLLDDLRRHWAVEDAERFAPGLATMPPEGRETATGLARRLRKAVDKWPRIP
ncbi:MAG: hypothetical protein A2005_08945 [Desulfuromonadales bacterium GWC2_61_20]|nr:MAG: hypothetical protein A2005_08945 [Desulfuromonadales bacterium GWC2_61_20]HBT83609.1 hypothetical protein [Desulfuromonas sp.]